MTDTKVSTVVESDNPALAFLLNRQSCHKLLAPGPSESELDLIVQAGLRAPDFMSLRPFRFLCARDEAGLTRLGEALQRAAIASKQSEVIINRAPKMPHRAPLILIAVASLKPSDVVPVLDQQFCASSTVLMMQLAARALGYGGVWRSGWPMYDRNLHQELGLTEVEQIVGFLYLGTPGHPDHALDPEDPQDFITWL
ncbi:nitroreductase [Azomonas agilis]|uniref:Putative NAD(P)H nitroreductase n=1 Tax=Azomonas agilis TaxID=116849 RepID=A0A562IZG5_9GAMM|nr:nitroreductase family protein [Azomonas agilis]TWH76296.1 nitroreductase [Azomonas agilis]